MTTQVDTTIDAPAQALIEEHVRRLLYLLGLEDVTVRCEPGADQSLKIDITAGPAGRLLIGMHGTHLIALQHVIRCLLRRHASADLRVTVDVNGYRARRERTLLSLAEETARKAHRTGRTVVMDPMTAADRRTVHTALANHKDIKTESLGDEPNRRVVVRPIFL